MSFSSSSSVFPLSASSSSSSKEPVDEIVLSSMRSVWLCTEVDSTPPPTLASSRKGRGDGNEGTGSLLVVRCGSTGAAFLIAMGAIGAAAFGLVVSVLLIMDGSSLMVSSA